MKIYALMLLTITSTTAMSDQHVGGYMKRNGTYVAPHYQTAPDRNPYNNYSTQGNTNPYTGQAGTRDPVHVQQQYSNPYGGNQPYVNPYGQEQHRRNQW